MLATISMTRPYRYFKMKYCMTEPRAHLIKVEHISLSKILSLVSGDIAQLVERFDV